MKVDVHCPDEYWTVHKRSEEDGAGRVEQVEISVMVDC